LPISHPIADGPNAPIIKNGLAVLMILFVAGVIYQLVKLKARKKTPQAESQTAM